MPFDRGHDASKRDVFPRRGVFVFAACTAVRRRRPMVHPSRISNRLICSTPRQRETHVRHDPFSVADRPHRGIEEREKVARTGADVAARRRPPLVSASNVR